MYLIVLTGLPGVGKTTVAATLTRSYGIRSINAGDALRAHLLDEGIACSSRAAIGPTFQKYHRDEDIFDVLVEHVQREQASVIDGVRLALTCKQFLTWKPDTCICLIRSRESVRVERIQANLRNLGSSMDEINDLLKEYARYNLEENSIMPMANIIIENDSTEHELQKKISSSFSKMIDA